MVEWVVRVVGAFLLAGGGWWLGEFLRGRASGSLWLPWLLLGAGAAIGGVLMPYVTLRPVLKGMKGFGAISTPTLVVATTGLVAGLVVGLLLSVPLSRLPVPAGVVVPIVVSLLLGALGAVLGVSRERDLVEGFPALKRLVEHQAPSERLILLDTSAIIDGRIADLAQTGFMPGALGVPRFILDELRHIADSSDALRRNRGRRGLEVLNRLRRETQPLVQVLDMDVRDGTEVDARLVRLARQLKAPILTTDFNLNRVAELQGVKVLNINELANALKPVVLPGEEMAVRIIQEGKE
ncbi:MAG: PIN domain nuclease, partial [Chloroflexi bacterium]|nr:PIN domain nuclease [Chloroflexota bacterium]